MGHMSRHAWNRPTDEEDADGPVGYVDRLRRSASHAPHSDMVTFARQRRECESRGEAGERLTSKNGPERNAAAAAAAAAAAERTRSGSNGREGKGSSSIWDRMWERGCWVCCGAEGGQQEEEAGVNMSNVVVMDAAEGVGGGAARAVLAAARG